MKNDEFILKCNQLTAAIREGLIGLKESDIKQIEQRHRLNQNFRRIMLVPVFVFIFGALLASVGSYLNSELNPSPDFHFDSYNEKLRTGTNTAIDDMQNQAEDRILNQRLDEERTPQMLIAIGFCICFAGMIVPIILLNAKRKASEDTKTVDKLIADLKIRAA